MEILVHMYNFQFTMIYYYPALTQLYLILLIHSHVHNFNDTAFFLLSTALSTQLLRHYYQSNPIPSTYVQLQLEPKMSTTPPIKTIAVIGTGVIGSSWIALFLAKGLNVTVTDPAPGAHEKLAAYLKREWPALEKVGLSEGASIDNYRFVDCIDGVLGEVDFVQEVSIHSTG